jgi:hypothetical protein
VPNWTVDKDGVVSEGQPFELKGGTTMAFDKEIAEGLMKSYPRDLISPDSLRSAPASQGDSDRRKEIERLQDVVKELEGKLAASVAEVDRLNAGILEFLKQDPNKPAPDTNPVVVAQKTLAKPAPAEK